MGKALVRCAEQFGDLSVAAAVEQPGHASLGSDVGALAGIEPTGVLLTDNIDVISQSDVCIDFSFHEAVSANVSHAAQSGVAVVLGTTGLTQEATAAVHAAAESVPIVWAPNMSMGVNVLLSMVEQSARALGLDYDAEIVEVHHRHKKDAPSGTALALAEQLAQGRNQDLEQVACYGRNGIIGERPRGEIGIHAVRSGDVVGEHTVSFATDGERIELVHRASSRDIFAMGALRAALWVHGKHPALYDMKDVLGL